MHIRKIGQNWVLALFAVSLLGACSKDKDDKKDPKASQRSGLNWLNQLGRTFDLKDQPLRVTDVDGKPIPQAQILVGSALDMPFVSNFLTTDANGTFSAPAGWTTEQVVTVSAPGYLRASFFGQVPNNQTYQLHLAESKNHFELNGQGLGFQTKDKDNLVDFALVMPLLNKQALFAFDMGMFISPLSDEIDIYGQKIELPSNVTLPKQKENYGFLSVNLEKPLYRLYFPTTGLKRVFAGRAQFPFKQVVQEFQNHKTFIDLVNYITILGGGIRDVTISAASQTLDLPVNELQFNQPKNFMSSDFASDEFMFAIPLSTFQGELMVTDIKNVPANSSIKLTTALGEKPQILVVVKKKAEATMVGRLTAAIVPFDDNLKPSLLPMLENPQVLAPDNIKVALPALPADMLSSATYLTLSNVDSKIVKKVKVETVSRVWEVYADGWQAEVKMPTWPNDPIVAGMKRWDVTLIGSKEHKNIDLGPQLFETMTHATHGSADF